jgi:hypothetical protein
VTSPCVRVCLENCFRNSSALPFVFHPLPHGLFRLFPLSLSLNYVKCVDRLLIVADLQTELGKDYHAKGTFK